MTRPPARAIRITRSTSDAASSVFASGRARVRPASEIQGVTSGSARGPGGWAFAGPVVVVPARVAALLVEVFDVDGLRGELEVEDREVAEVLASLSAAGRVWSAHETFSLPGTLPHVAGDLPLRGNACGSSLVHVGSPGDVVPPGWVPLEDAAALAGVPVRTLRHRCARGAVAAAMKIRGAWWLDPAAVMAP